MEKTEQEQRVEDINRLDTLISCWNDEITHFLVDSVTKSLVNETTKFLRELKTRKEQE
jgi:hypothetical protein